MCRQTVVKQIDDLYGAMIKDLKDEMSKYEYICITADLWTGDNRDPIQWRKFCLSLELGKDHAYPTDFAILANLAKSIRYARSTILE